MNTSDKYLTPLKEDQLDEDARKAVQAARRAAEKLRKRKRLLGQKLVVYQEGKVVTIDP